MIKNVGEHNNGRESPIKRSREQKLMEKYEKVAQKIEIIKSLQKLIKKHADEDSEAFSEIIEKEITKIMTSQPPGLYSRRRRLKKINSRINLINEVLLRLGVDNIEEEENLHLELNQLKQEMRLYNDCKDDILFFNRIQDFSTNIKSKHEKYHSLKGIRKSNIAAVIREYFNADPEYFNVLMIEDIVCSNLSINVIIQPEAFDRLINKEGGKISGVHISGSVINVIKNNNTHEDLIALITHESNHNIAEAFLSEADRHGYSGEDLYQELGDLVNLHNQYIKNDKTKMVFREDIKLIFNGLFSANLNELLADLDNIKKGKIYTYFVSIAEFLDKYYQLVDTISDEGLKDFLLNIVGNFEDKFANLLNKIGFVVDYSLSNQLNDQDDQDNFEKVRALFVLFGSKHFRRIERHIRHGDSEGYDLIKHFAFIKNNHGYFETIFELYQKRERNGFGRIGSDYLLKKIAEPQNLLVDFFDLEKLKRIGDILNKKENVDRLEKYFGGRDQLMKSIKEILGRFDGFKQVLGKYPYLQKIKNITELNQVMNSILNSLGCMETQDFINQKALPAFKRLEANKQ
ncbi:MAG: hypothetical protein GF332_02235 [Candidatus Moranbacteria bacterium]|nr:hypothetical protein [Candidatus Moranbacteria bacterium]